MKFHEGAPKGHPSSCSGISKSAVHLVHDTVDYQKAETVLHALGSTE